MNNTLSLVLAYSYRCHCHCCFSRHCVILNPLLRNLARVLGIHSVIRAHSFNVTVLPHAENGWAMQNFWSTPRTMISALILLCNRQWYRNELLNWIGIFQNMQIKILLYELYWIHMTQMGALGEKFGINIYLECEFYTNQRRNQVIIQNLHQMNAFLYY